MQSCYPSLTFPNHYSIVTGLYPSHHGIVDNTFMMNKNKLYTAWEIKRPLQIVHGMAVLPYGFLQKNKKMLTASFYWVASESAIQGIRPTYYYIYGEAIPIEKRIEAVKNWLQLPDQKRPHLITFYFPKSITRSIDSVRIQKKRRRLSIS